MARGAHAEGLDFAAPMVQMACRNFPDLPFRQGDAEKLPYPDESFDFAACAFGILHLDDPDAALREVFRILEPADRFAFTTWLPPERARILAAILEGAEGFRKDDKLRWPYLLVTATKPG